MTTNNHQGFNEEPENSFTNSYQGFESQPLQQPNEEYVMPHFDQRYEPPIREQEPVIKPTREQILKENQFTFLALAFQVTGMLIAIINSGMAFIVTLGALIFAIVSLVKKEKLAWINWVIIGYHVVTFVGGILLFLFFGALLSGIYGYGY